MKRDDKVEIGMVNGGRFRGIVAQTPGDHWIDLRREKDGNWGIVRLSWPHVVFYTILP